MIQIKKYKEVDDERSPLSTRYCISFSMAS